MCLLNVINKIFLDVPLRVAVGLKAYEILRQAHPRAVFLFIKAKNNFKNYLTIILAGVVIYYIGRVSTTLINWIFFALNVLNLVALSNNDGKKSTLTHSLRIANCIRYYAVFIMILEICMAWLIGMRATNQAGSRDEYMRTHFNFIYESLQLIGIRMYIKPGEESRYTDDDYNTFFSLKFSSYVVYLLIAMYFSNRYAQQLKSLSDLSAVSEAGYKRIFEFKNDTQEEDLKTTAEQGGLNREGARAKPGSNRDLVEMSQVEAKRGDASILRKISPGEDGEAAENGRTGVRQRTQRLNKLDFLEFYELFRYDPGYLAYKRMSWWPFYDFCATYGHFFTNLLIVIISTQVAVNFYMLLNVILVCFLYTHATVRLSKCSQEYFQQSGMQSQIDLQMASLISKKYQKGAFYELLTIRKRIWKIQLTLLLIVGIMGFPTTLLNIARVKFVDESYEKNKEVIAKIDAWTFWIFISGLWKDERSAE